MRIVTTVITFTAAVQPSRNDHRANNVLYVACLAQLRLLRAAQYSKTCCTECLRQLCNYSLGHIPTGVCLFLQGQAGSLERIIEVLMRGRCQSQCIL